jgi:hypothetical protein
MPPKKARKKAAPKKTPHSNPSSKASPKQAPKPSQKPKIKFYSSNKGEAPTPAQVENAAPVETPVDNGPKNTPIKRSEPPVQKGAPASEGIPGSLSSSPLSSPPSSSDEEEVTIPADYISEPVSTPFKIFRGLYPSTKVGAFWPNNEDNDISGIFFLDTTIRQNTEAHVIDIFGEGFPVPLRLLQHLESAWGFPDYLPVLPSPVPVNPNLSEAAIIERVKKRNVRLPKEIEKGNEKPKLQHWIDALDKWENNRFGALPMGRLTKAYAAKTAKGEVDFELHEIVRLISEPFEIPGLEKGLVDILDFEGQPGRVEGKHLSPLLQDGQPLDSLLPFGLRIARKTGPESLVTPYTEVGSRPAARAEAVRAMTLVENIAFAKQAYKVARAKHGAAAEHVAAKKRKRDEENIGEAARKKS